MNVQHAVALHQATMKLEGMSPQAQAAFAGVFSGREEDGRSMKLTSEAQQNSGLSVQDLHAGLLQCVEAGFLAVIWHADGWLEVTIETKKEPA